MYFRDGEYFFGLSYALAIGFTLFALSGLKIDRKKGAAGIFGGSYLKVAKPAILIITLISVLYAYRKMAKTTSCKTCVGNSCELDEKQPLKVKVTKVLTKPKK